MKRKFLNIEIEDAPLELELSVEQRCRNILASDDIYSIKRYCTHLVKHQMKQDVFLASLLGRLMELEAQVVISERKTKRKNLFKKMKRFFRIA
tara:strand:+ start:249 stop:527 length:279 start_codon:yes stop_codon:yes gene_type:complete